MADNYLQQKLAENAQQPRRAQGDAGSVEQHSLRDQIAADRYLSARDAARKRGSLGIKLLRISPPGAA